MSRNHVSCFDVPNSHVDVCVTLPSTQLGGRSACPLTGHPHLPLFHERTGATRRLTSCRSRFQFPITKCLVPRLPLVLHQLLRNDHSNGSAP